MNYLLNLCSYIKMSWVEYTLMENTYPFKLWVISTHILISNLWFWMSNGLYKYFWIRKQSVFITAGTLGMTQIYWFPIELWLLFFFLVILFLYFGGRHILFKLNCMLCCLWIPFYVINNWLRFGCIGFRFSQVSSQCNRSHCLTQT